MAQSHDLSMRVNQLTFGYGDTPVLNDVSMVWEPGSFSAIFGPNGSGKTTLLKLISGILSPGTGTVTLGGKALEQWDREALARSLAVVPQEADVVFPFSVEEVVLMGRSPYLGRSPFESEADRAVANQAMEWAQVSDLRHRNFLTCSGGERQRVLLARALAQEPKVLLLDEAGAHLDLHHQVQLYRCLEMLNRQTGLTIVMVSHDWNLPAQFCSSALLLSGGKVTAQGSLEDVIDEERIESVYGTPVRVGRDDETGHLFVIPKGRRAEKKKDGHV